MDINSFNYLQLAALIDYAFLKIPGAGRKIEDHCEEAAQWGFAMVAIHPCDVEVCAQFLQGTRVHIGAVVGFPLGNNTLAVKEFETKDAIARGANEIDMMINFRALLAGDAKTVSHEITSIVDLCQSNGVVSKIILETCYLSQAQKVEVCRMAVEAGANYVKTSTGFGPAGATVEDVKLMRAVVGESTGVKAAGGIRNLDHTLAMINAGANRIGTSSGVAIVQELQARQAALLPANPS